MSEDRVEALRRVIDRTHATTDYPALLWQTEQWRTTRPLNGVRLLDATPLFGNTLAKYLPLVAGGADLTVSLSPLLPHDPGAVEILDQIGIPVLDAPQAQGSCDVIVDCAGVHANTPSRVGHVELTKSGERLYASSPTPVMLVDDSRIKLIETSLGTGDGFVRGMAHFGYPVLTGRSVVVFGGGKVGRGVALRARDAGATVTVVDPDTDLEPLPGCTLLDATNRDAVQAAVASAWCLASATGRFGALAWLTGQLRDSAIILANLGAEDEFGPDLPAQRVLNGKAPLNFALDEPTRLRFIDATMALDNACALELLSGGYPAGINRAPRWLEDEILEVVRTRGTIGHELTTIGDDFA